jgi:hypothetical protein
MVQATQEGAGRGHGMRDLCARGIFRSGIDPRPFPVYLKLTRFWPNKANHYAYKNAAKKGSVMFALRVAKSQTKTAARRTTNLTRHRSTLVGGFQPGRNELDASRSIQLGIIAQEQEARRLGNPGHIPLI